MKQLISLFLIIALPGCNEKIDLQPQEEFVKIYDDDRFNEQYDPLDIVETSKGFIILSSYRRDDSNFRGLNIIEVNELGDYESGSKFQNDFVSPVKSLMEKGGKYYFFCMDQFSLGVRLIELDDAGEVLNAFTVNATFPLAAASDGNNFILQSYDHLSKKTVLSIVDPTGGIVNSAQFDIGSGEGVEEPIIDHFNQTGRVLPFIAGKASNGLYFFNGFYNFTLSLVFSDLADDTPNGVCQGQQSEGGISSVTATGNDLFAISRFNFGDNYINPNVSISTSSITSSLDLGGNPFPELTSDSRVEVKEIQINGNPTLIYAATTNSSQIVLMGYNKNNFSLNAIDYLGFANPYSLAGFTSTRDGGLAVVGMTRVAGRFPRICFFKLSSNRVTSLGN